MRFQVPQFINVEDKIFGPLTLKQFLYLAGGGGFCLLFYRFLPVALAILLMIPAVGLSLMLAFYKVNNKPFVNIVESAFKYSASNKLYIWNKNRKKTENRSARTNTRNSSPVIVPHLSGGKLKDLAWNLDIKENLNPGTQETMQTLREKIIPEEIKSNNQSPQ